MDMNESYLMWLVLEELCCYFLSVQFSPTELKNLLEKSQKSVKNAKI